VRSGIRGLVLLIPLAVGCSTELAAPDADGNWVGRVTTEGSVTTVVNESGSMWGGTVEFIETLSIGADSSDQRYLLGQVWDVGTTADRIYILDSQLSAVRVFDHAGNHLFDIGDRGQGPGEFTFPRAMGIDPDGRLLVQDRIRVSVFDLDGTFIETWPYRGQGHPVTVAVDGTAFVPWRWTDNEQVHTGLVGILPDGSERVRIMPMAFEAGRWALVARRGGRVISGMVTYAPSSRLGVSPSGALMRGTSDAYQFEIEHPDGRRTVVERTVELPIISAEQREWLTRLWTARMRAVQPDWTWTANPVPDRKPAFDWFFGDRYGRIWLRRVVGTKMVSDCANDASSVHGSSPRSCWKDRFAFDIFDEKSGRFLGQVGLPEGVSHQAWPAFVKDGFLAVVEDDAGTFMVKRYELIATRQSGR